MSNTPDPGELLTTEELAAVLSVHVETVRRWSRAYLIPFMELPKGRRYSLAEVRAALAAVPPPVDTTESAAS